MYSRIWLTRRIRRFALVSGWRATPRPDFSVRIVASVFNGRDTAVWIQDRRRALITSETNITCIREAKRQSVTCCNCLRQSHRNRRKRHEIREKRERIIGRKDQEVDELPRSGEEKGRFGDGESDTAEGAKGTGYVATHVERKSQYVVLARMGNKKVRTLNRATRRAFRRHEDVLLETMTVDNGKEFAAHATAFGLLDIDVNVAKS